MGKWLRLAGCVSGLDYYIATSCSFSFLIIRSRVLNLVVFIDPCVYTCTNAYTQHMAVDAEEFSYLSRQ